ncbi:hypothetical protein JTE90_021012, partial [Oedothorax gibbosus]
ANTGTIKSSRKFRNGHKVGEASWHRNTGSTSERQVHRITGQRRSTKKSGRASAGHTVDGGETPTVAPRITREQGHTGRKHPRQSMRGLRRRPGKIDTRSRRSRHERETLLGGRRRSGKSHHGRRSGSHRKISPSVTRGAGTRRREARTQWGAVRRA